MNASEVGEGAGAGAGAGGAQGPAPRSGDTFDHDPSRFKGAQEPRLGAEKAG